MSTSGTQFSSVYDQKPERFLEKLHSSMDVICSELFCAGFEFEQWRCKPFAFHLAEWLPDYALPESELRVNHANSLAKLNQAAVRVYTSEKYEKRGEAGEIALHAICRDFFGTIPISPRVFYKSASNDVIKAFDMVHVRFTVPGGIEVWLGESKLYADGTRAVADAIASIKEHIDAGFLTNQKLLLGPQIPATTPRYEEINSLFKRQTSLDELLESAVFAIGILCDSKSVKTATKRDSTYLMGVTNELVGLAKAIISTSLPTKIKIVLIYIPLESKKALVDTFHARLKGLQ